MVWILGETRVRPVMARLEGVERHGCDSVEHDGPQWIVHWAAVRSPQCGRRSSTASAVIPTTDPQVCPQPPASGGGRQQAGGGPAP